MVFVVRRVVWFAVLAILLPLRVRGQTAIDATPLSPPLVTEANQDGSPVLVVKDQAPSPPSDRFWNVDIAVTGTFTPVGGDTSKGRGLSASMAVIPVKPSGKEVYSGLGIVGLFTKTSADGTANVARRGETWMLGGVRLAALSDIAISVQLLGGVKKVTFEDPPPVGAALSAAHGAIGVGTTWTVPLPSRFGIRIFDLNWFATPGDALSPHRWSLAFGVDYFPFGYVSPN